MGIKAGRDVLCFDDTGKQPDQLSNNIKILQKSKEAPPNFKYQDRGCPCLLFPGSFTVEVAFSAVFFFLALFSLLYLFLMLFGVCRVQMRLASAVQQYECYGTKAGTVEGLLKQQVLIQWDEEKEICYVQQKREIPFLGGQFFEVLLYQQMKINRYEGESMASAAEAGGEYVYIAENGRVYHTDKGCIYLNPGIQSIRYSRVEFSRNHSGGKYKVCKICSNGEEIVGKTVVYITPYGDSYHLDKACSGLKRTIRKVLLSEIGKMPPCSKCERRY
jgi:hypothetical protein